MKTYKKSNDTYLKGYKIQIFPNEYQKAYIERCFELVRYVWNWALEKEETQYRLYKENNKLSKFLLDKELLDLYKIEKEKNAFLGYMNYETSRRVIRNLVDAYMEFFNKNRKHPKFKSKKHSPDYLPLRYDTTYFFQNMLKIPGLSNKILTNRNTDYKYQKDNPTYYNCKITKDNFGNYWFHYSIKETKNSTYFSENNIPKSETIGIDLNVENTICCSNGIIYKKPNLNKINKRIKRYQRAVQKDTDALDKAQKKLKRTNSIYELQPSKNATKRRIKLNKACKKKKDIIRNFINQSISSIIKMNPKAIVMEGLNVKDIKSKHYIAKTAQDCKFSLIRELMEKKCEQFNIPFFLANRYFKSSQICSVCGTINKHHSDYHTYHCKKCGNTIDRDLNAAKNLASLYEDYDYSFEFVA